MSSRWLLAKVRLLRKPVSMFLSRCKGPSEFKACQFVALLILGIAGAPSTFAQSQSKPNVGPGVASAHAAVGSATPTALSSLLR